MHLQQLRAFCEVANELSFTRAAKNLYYAQSSVTAQIHGLEEVIGARLFDRSGRQVALTPAGLLLLPYAQHIVEVTEEARRSVQEASRASESVGSGARLK
ncbi:LysR family transcriptional regulator [Streptomyces acidicola]|uniref:LysR family transcriptional regulator n=1 Tax=Streptomyces acidicola TaxID=2596892 RepID=A0A5N8WS34_9ACTN|nr:LysR family transcriptional regulator [Streptomyces acidicola]MPY49952.1 LysR family transcriptional regulator [Streptomyces acidicola]